MKVKERNKNFFMLFFRRELIPLSGKNFSNLGIIILLLFIAFTVIGFAEGSLRYLEQKMKDPFINWVTVMPAHGGYPTARVLEELNTAEFREKYSLLNAMGYVRFRFSFYSFDEIESYYHTGELNDENIHPLPARTIYFDDPLIPEIFSRRNLIAGNPFESPTDIGLVIREDMLQRLGYPLNTPYVWMDFLAYRDDLTDIRVPVPVPVQAVVRSLPGLAGFATTPYFFQQRSLRFGRNPFNPINDGRLVLSYHGDNIADLLKATEDVFREKHTDQNYSFSAVWQEKRYLPGNNEKYLVFVNFSPGEVPLQILDKMFLEFFRHNSISSFRSDLYRLYDYERRFTAPQDFHDYDRISLNFSGMHHQLRSFSLMLSEKFNLEVDMAQIESRENYNFVSDLTFIISLVLIGFSVLSILLFVSYLLKRHLESIKRNLGTFKAFGLSNKFLIKLYVQIVLTIIGIATIAALFLSAVFGYSGGMRLILLLFGSNFEAGNYFSLVSYYLFIALTILLIFSIWVLRMVSAKILNNTPGDLIYERD